MVNLLLTFFLLGLFVWILKRLLPNRHIGQSIASRIGASDNYDTRPEPYIWLGRFVTWVPITTTVIGAVLGFSPFWSLGGALLGGLLGFGAGAIIVVSSLEKYFIIRNSTTGMFITQDVLKSLAGAADEDFHISYGPGVHISLPWERRLKENNISLEEAAQDFEFKVQCMDGTLTCRGSFRLRPDQSKGIVFLRGVAAVASEITDLISKVAIQDLSKKSVANALLEIKNLNDHLTEEITKGDRTSKLEARFGIDITDATVAELLPSEELQRTISAKSEAAAIAEGTATLLGMTVEEVKAARAAGTLSQSDYNEARDRFLSVSGNLDGMDIKRSEWVVKTDGVDPDLVRALGNLGPAATKIAEAFGNANSKNQSGGRKRNRGRHKPKQSNKER